MYQIGKWAGLMLRVEGSFHHQFMVKESIFKGTSWIVHNQKEVLQFKLQCWVVVVMFQDGPTCFDVRQSFGGFGNITVRC